MVTSLNFLDLSALTSCSSLDQYGQNSFLRTEYSRGDTPDRRFELRDIRAVYFEAGSGIRSHSTQ